MGSLRSWWLLWAGATLLWGLTQEASVDPKNSGGEEFLTAFLQNYNRGYSNAYLYLLLSSLSDNLTSVSILSQVDGTSQKVTVRPGQSVMVNITAKAEMVGSSTFQRAVVVHSDRTISVQAINAKPNTADATQLWPVRALGTEYFVFTPSSASSQNLKEFAVVAGAAGASVSIQLKGSVTFRGKSYSAGNVLSVTLDPYQVAQVQSTANLSGSKVTASSPVAVLSGHSCAQKNTNCNHVVEQLLPTSAWGTYYVVPPLSLQTRSDLVYVVASQATKLTYNLGGTSGSRELQAGNVAEFEIQQSQPLYLSADVGIQVLLFGTGTTKDGVTYDPHLVLIPDVAAYCPAYVVKCMPNCKCVALVVAPTKAAGELTIDGQRLGANLTWAVVPGSEFSYAEVDLGTKDSIHVAEAATSFGLLTFGLNQDVSFGTAAACGRTLQTQEPSCEGKQCGPKQLCKVLDGQARCLADSAATCRAQGDPHYTTFDGRRYDMMGTCLYSMAELCSDDQTLPAFSVETKNEHRGSRSVSYVGLVTVRAYNHAVSLARGEVGFARIDSQRSRLPASLAEGRLRVYQSGTRAMVELDFGLVVTYDWDAQLALSLPVHFQGQVCGLCGNYNGDPTDDFLTPDREQAPDAVEFASSWKLDDEDYLCEDGCQNNCPSCTPDQAQHYEDSRLCGMLTQLDGPFAVCRDALDPQPFLKECVYDLCVASGDRASLCRALNAYAQACLEFGISVGNWRLPASCPLSCPANSRYELCGPACPASCNPAAVPSNCSSRPCVEGCVCLPGFVASGGACVATSSCGCNFEGRPLAPGQEVWADEYCRRRCTCDAATQQVRCSDTQGCPAGERCRVQNGLLGCYPDSFGSCQASGDPHYVSFDGRRFDFMGTCTYLLAGSCGQAAGLPAFRVLVENEHRGSQTVSYTRAVRVEARGVKVAVRREYPGRVLVDGILQYLPFQAADGQVQVFRQGQDAVVRTDFGLTVTYNWDAHVTAKVPSSYAGVLCGLCGNFNGDPADDLALRGGGQAANALAFGKSWQEETRPGCGAAEPGDCPKLDNLVAQQLQSKKECGILADPSGPFRECHRTLDPQGAVRDCVYDRCLLPGQSGPLCDALASYAAACQAAGATVHPWRSEQLCPLSCPPHSHYEACSYGCPLSCGDLPVPGGCGFDCKEGCVCDEGFVLNGESCVPLPSCGCVYEGTYHPPGQTFHPGSGCNSLCHCEEGGLVSCEPSSCGPHEACQPSGGVLGCVVVGSATCQASGDPHYTTFDGRRFDFMGTCVYSLARTCGTQPGLAQFAVLQENVAWGNGKVSVTRVVTVQVANFTLRLEQKQWKVTVNGVDKRLPVVLAEGQVRASQHGSDVVIETDFGLRVAYDLAYNVRVTIPGNYYQQLCGLCGNYNGDPKDDFQKPDGSQAGSSNEFGNSWQEAVPGSPCLPTCKPGESCDTELECKPELQEKYEQQQFCGLLTSPTGPLAACHKLVDPQGPLKDCVFDLCVGGGNESILCSNVHAYVSACQAAGGHVEPWRTESFCPMQCPPNSHYELCADTCSLGCWALSAPPQCPDSCAEGCQCDSGFLNDGQACVPIQECGCYHNGVYYELGQTVLIDNCQQQCVCHAGKGLLCQDHSCNPEQVCQPSGGVLSCVTKDPCHGVTCQPQETCQEKNGQGVCVPNYEATCWLWGDPHYHSFDGWDFDFQGTCSYVLASTSCPGSSAQGLTSFTVTTKNENRGNPSVSYVRLVTVTILNTTISIHKGEIGKVRVNGVLTALPVSVAGGQLSVTQGVSRAVLATDFGLRVSYDWDWRVEVTLPSSYHGVVCGLCGNMDHNPSNDQAFPNGTLAPSIPVWGGSWRVPGWDPLCWDECQGSCPTCAEDRLEEYRGPGFCGPLAPGSGGPFAACHAHVAPDSFFKGCVLDVCLGGGAQDILCQALAAYAAACQAAGIVIKDWRTQAGCELSCPENGHYELCGPPCPASCPSPAPPTASAPCGGPCTEGCQCDSGFVLSTDRCVPLDGGCGCWANGTYHEAGSEFWADATCSQRCHCGPGGGSLVCKPASCGLGEECALLPSGQHGCRPISTAECQAWGDPHYITLDRHHFNFQGACEYLLSMPCHRLPPGVENFTVTVDNEHRGSQAISYTRTVTLHIYGHSFTLSARRPRQLQVDGTLVALPFQLDSRLRAHLSGADVVVTTATAISLAFDGDNNVRLRVPAAYAGTLCGLCGNYNQNPNDDLNAVGGNPDGWQVGGAEGCGECVPGPCPQPCTQEQQEPFGGPDACGVISAPDGPLAPCHSHVPPTQYFQACLLDACQAQGHPGGLCPAVATYVVACQAAGAQLGEWRRPDFCPLQCPAHSHYKLCGDSCPVSCPSLSAPEGCESTCREGCFCDAGFVLSGDTCVPVGQCGCLHEGRYYPLGKDFYPGPECERRCECGPGGQVSCQEGAACGPYEECRLQDGVQACRPTGCGRCLASGGIHYITLDGRAYDLHGSCSYILAQVCHPQPGDEDFTIVLENNAAGDPQRLVVTVAGQVVGLARGPQVTVDGEAVALPVAVGHVRVTAEGRNMILQTTKQLRLLFDGDAYILISIPSPFRDRLCGLCGNFNGNWNDDFVLPSGAMAPSVDAFGAAWRAPGSSQGCGEGCGPQGCPLCSAEETAPYENLEACGRLQDAKGPFSACHAALSPSEYFRQCVYDLCAQKGNSATLCRSLSAYTAACQAAGVAVKPWRTDSFCPLQCPAHSHYSICTHSCQGSCAALSGLTGCTTRCFEGCECDDRFLLSQGVCIPVQDCGCTHDGRYLPANSSLLTSDCSERCSCSSSTGQTCQAASCPPGRVCEVQAGVRDCWVSRGLCSLSVDANLTTFDGARSVVSSPGIYELSFRCPGLQETVPWYRVVADVWPCDSKAAVLGHVHIFFQDGLVTVTRKKGVWVNGLQVDLPAEVLTSVSVSRNPDGSVLVQQKAGVRVQLGTDGQLAVVVGDDHAGMLCGACGNFDADQTNDGHDPQKETTLENWRAQDFSPCLD
ncbi:LOW QUALITY PROTEIN: IgGFc-binding protein [Sagmatias obliquidens]|uniref:LOW QUALITY PROTEIN: IgGFc-binding protein n=1 Tax=Sagmatias obliquidens TaxID=3371155 RepID=UPI000F444A47|nr:LOW QUALITY PROTEIN: IgGFc-binding protein [Lagenorhynchus obliquidens]